jgi:hypothetical protein
MYWRAADRAVRIAPKFEFDERGTQRIKHQEAANQWLADARHQFDDFVGLQEAHNPGKHAQDTSLTSGWGK